MATAAKRMKTEAVHAPTTRAEAEASIKTIGEKQQQIKRIEADLNDKINELKAKAQERITPLNEEIQAQFQGLHVFAEANKTTLLTGRSKTIKLGAGDIGWRTSQPTCKLTAKAAIVIQRLKDAGLKAAVRLKEEVNKEVVLADPAKYKDIKGLSVTQKEEFWVRPHETELERVEVVK